VDSYSAFHEICREEPVEGAKKHLPFVRAWCKMEKTTTRGPALRVRGWTPFNTDVVPTFAHPGGIWRSVFDGPKLGNPVNEKGPRMGWPANHQGGIVLWPHQVVRNGSLRANPARNTFGSLGEGGEIEIVRLPAAPICRWESCASECRGSGLLCRTKGHLS